MKLPDTAHTEAPWRVHALAPDFVLEDVWALPTPGGPDDLALLVQQFAAKDDHLTGPVGFLMAVRWKLGRLFGWDGEGDGVGARVTSLRERLPEDLLEGDPGPIHPDLPFRSVYQTHDEWVSEIANRTVHALMHIGWVQDAEDPAGCYRGQMAVLVKPNGTFGKAYMAAIKPFRLLIVYPSLLRKIGRDWRSRRPREAPTG